MILGISIDPIEARKLDGRSGDANVNLFCSGFHQKLDDLLRGGAADNGIVDEHETLALNVFDERGQFHLNAQFAQLLVGGNERPVDVAALDHALAVRNATDFTEAQRRRYAAVRYRDDDVGFTGVLNRQTRAHSLASTVEQLPEHLAVGSCKVNELKEAHRLFLKRHASLDSHSVLIDDDHLSRFEFVSGNSAHRSKSAGLACYEVAFLPKSARCQRADPKRVPKSNHALGSQNGDAVGSLGPQHNLTHGFFWPLVHVVDEDPRQHLAVARGIKMLAVGLHLRPKFLGIDEVAVVSDGNFADEALAIDGLCVAKNAGSGGAVSGVTDPHVSWEGVQHLFVEDVGHQPHVFVKAHLGTIADGNARRFLAPMLKRK